MYEEKSKKYVLNNSLNLANVHEFWATGYRARPAKSLKHRKPGQALKKLGLPWGSSSWPVLCAGPMAPLILMPYVKVRLGLVSKTIYPKERNTSMPYAKCCYTDFNWTSFANLEPVLS